jgi:hypothetical protein
MRLIRWTAVLLAGSFLALLVPVGADASTEASTAQAQASPTAPLTDIPVAGTLSDGSAFEGVLTITEVAAENGRLLGTGTLAGTAGSMPVAQSFQGQDLGISALGSCEILDLDLGAIHLDLLGLVVDLAPVHLDITALTGPGQLVGNLLCAIVGLLDGGPIGQLLALLQLLNGLLG